MTDPTVKHAWVQGQWGNEANGKHGVICVPRAGHVQFQRSEVRQRTQDHPICQQLCEHQHRTGHPSLSGRGLVGIECRLIQDLGNLDLVKVPQECLDVCGWRCGGGQCTGEEVTEAAFGG